MVCDDAVVPSMGEVFRAEVEGGYQNGLFDGNNRFFVGRVTEHFGLDHLTFIPALLRHS
jgi:hypothetical protein